MRHPRGAPELKKALKNYPKQTKKSPLSLPLQEHREGSQTSPKDSENSFCCLAIMRTQRRQCPRVNPYRFASSLASLLHRSAAIKPAAGFSSCRIFTFSNPSLWTWHNFVHETKDVRSETRFWSSNPDAYTISTSKPASTDIAINVIACGHIWMYVDIKI